MKRTTRYILVNPGSSELDLMDEMIGFGFTDLEEAGRAGSIGGKYTTVSGLMKVTVTIEEIK